MKQTELLKIQRKKWRYWKKWPITSSSEAGSLPQQYQLASIFASKLLSATLSLSSTERERDEKRRTQFQTEPRRQRRGVLG